MGVNMTQLKKIAMISVHGYLDPIPQLGRVDTGGQILYVIEVAKELSSIFNIQVDIFTRWFDKSKKQVESIPNYENVSVIRIPAGEWKFIPKEEIYPILPELAQNLYKYIKYEKLQYDLIHSHYIDAGIVSIDVAKELNIPCFFTPHSLGGWKRAQLDEHMSENISPMNSNIDKRIAEETRVFNSVKAYTLTTFLQKEKLAKYYDITNQDCEIIPRGVDIEFFHPNHGDNGNSNTLISKEYLFTLGRIDKAKGHFLLLKAFDILRKDYPELKLIIGGGSSNPEPTEERIIESMRRLIEKRDMKGSVHIIGYVPRNIVVSYYQNATAYILPSVFDSFGITVLEAMACATPVIVSKYAGITNVLKDNKNALIIDPENSQEFSDKIYEVLKNNHLRNKLGKNGRLLTEKEFSWESVAKKHIDFYNKYLNL